MDIELTVKRLNKRQKNQANPLADQELDTETYYRITVFVPYIDYFITELEDRFLSHSDIFKGSILNNNTLLSVLYVV